MFVSQEKLIDISWHENVKGTGIIIPIQFDPTIEIDCPVFGEFIFLFDAPY
jgi:hypothetical protein